LFHGLKEKFAGCQTVNDYVSVVSGFNSLEWLGILSVAGCAAAASLTTYHLVVDFWNKRLEARQKKLLECTRKEHLETLRQKRLESRNQRRKREPKMTAIAEHTAAKVEKTGEPPSPAM
jgi:hypothetical protein